MDPFLWLVGFVIFAESAFFLGILFVLAFYGWRLLRHIWQGTAFTAYHIENEILYIHNVFETSCPLSDIERVEARKVLLYRRPLSGGAKYFIRLYRKNGRKTGMIIWGEGFKYYNYGVPGDSLPDDGWMGLVFPCIKKQGMRFLNEFH